MAISQGHIILEVPVSSPHYELPTNGEEPLDDFVDLGIDDNKIIDDPSGPGRKIKIPAVTVTANGNERHHYSHVISTLPLPILRTIDLSDAGLNVMKTMPCARWSTVSPPRSGYSLNQIGGPRNWALWVAKQQQISRSARLSTRPTVSTLVCHPKCSLPVTPGEHMRTALVLLRQ